MDSYMDFLADYANLNIRNIDEVEYDRIKTMAYKVCDYLIDSRLISENVRGLSMAFAFDYIVRHDGIRGMRSDGALDLLVKNTRENGIALEKQRIEDIKKEETEKRKNEVNMSNQGVSHEVISIEEYLTRKLNRFYNTGILKKDVNLGELTQNIINIYLESDITPQDVARGIYDKNLALILANGNNFSDDFYKVKVKTFDSGSKADKRITNTYNSSEEREMHKNEITAILMEHGVNMSNIDREKCDEVVSNYLDREYNRYRSIREQKEKREKAIRRSERNSEEDRIKRLVVALAALGYLAFLGGKVYNAYEERQEEDRLKSIRSHKTSQSVNKSTFHDVHNVNGFYDYDDNEFVIGESEHGRSV